MQQVLLSMLKKYSLTNEESLKNALREIIQEIVLCALSRTDFFDNAAFYGGTALRIFYDLPRYSEDLDFTLKQPNEHFKLEKYLNKIVEAANAYGLNVSVTEKEKTKDTAVKSAFLKANTKQHSLLFTPDRKLTDKILNNEVTKIKLEVDTNPPYGATFEYKVRQLPRVYELCTCDKPSLFAGKLHAVICRDWKGRVKGRDFYDYLFYLAGETEINIEYLSAKLKRTGAVSDGAVLDSVKLKELLINKIDTVDFDAVKKDVKTFIKDNEEITNWSSDYFRRITESWNPVFV